MATYQAKSNTPLSFNLSKGEDLIGRLSYANWFSFNALIKMASNSTYSLEPKGFWGTKIELKDDGKVLLEFEINWKG